MQAASLDWITHHAKCIATHRDSTLDAVALQSSTVLIAFNISRSVSLTHWGRVTHICVSKLTIIGSDNGLSPGRRQAIIWTNAGILLVGPLGTNFSEILIGIQLFSFKKMHLKMSSAKWRPFCPGLNVLIGVQGCLSLHLVSSSIEFPWGYKFAGDSLSMVTDLRWKLCY